jgi:SAM-dependent methyltransferase
LTPIAAAASEMDWARDRPRLLSHVGRWGRARRWLPKDARRVIDIGCAFGYGTVAIASRKTPPCWIAGVEYDPGNTRQAHGCYPWLPMVRGDGTLLPFADASIDAVVILDVLEHLAEPSAVLCEVRRVLRPGGALIISVPHRGLLAGLDSNNLYAAIQRKWRRALPLEPCEESASGTHRHFTAPDLQRLLGANFHVDKVARTGFGLGELLHLSLLLLFKGVLRWRGAYLALRSLYFTAYLVEDLAPAGPLGYNLTIRARAADKAHVSNGARAQNEGLSE